MKTFLEYVAEDLLSKYGSDMSRTAVVFPNKRAALFMDDCLARLSDGPLWSPSYTTISDLFRRHAQLDVADRLKLICDLHKSYQKITGSPESLDHFFGWGTIMLADFDDIDKSMADAGQVFRNLSGLHEMDDVSFLSQEQRETLRKFFSHFTDEKDSELKRRFLYMWNRLSDVYADFNGRLRRQGLAYEGALYRSVADDETAHFEFDRYIFVGFNVLQKVEQHLFDRLKRDGKAKFYWDFDEATIDNCGPALRGYMLRYPNELDSKNPDVYSNFNRPKKITYLSAPTDHIQARYISHWLREQDGLRIRDGRRTAVVMCDEGLLQTVVHCIPPEVASVNITTGYPLSMSPLGSLLHHLITLRTEGQKDRGQAFRTKHAVQVVSHPYFKFLTPAHAHLAESLRKAGAYYHKANALSIDDGTRLVFGPIADEHGDPNLAILCWLLNIIKSIASQVRVGAAPVGATHCGRPDPLLQESLFQTYRIVQRLQTLVADGDLRVDPLTLRRLLSQVIKSTSIPFHGEPAVGVQVMGLLETRNLDFDHVLMLSCNEGKMPKGVADTSLIPHSIRKAHGLTTIDHKVAIYSYYFHRLLQRAADVSLAYNTSTEGVQKGEMSRFMLQLMALSPHQIERRALMTRQAISHVQREPIEKTVDVMRRLIARFSAEKNPSPQALLTPTAINTYLRCPLQFYYHYVEGINEPDNDDLDAIDAAMFGNIFHNSAQRIYERLCASTGPRIEKSRLRNLLSHRSFISGIVEEEFNRELYHGDAYMMAHPQRNGLHHINLSVITSFVEQLLKTDLRLAPFTIVGLEKEVVRPLVIETPEGLRVPTTIGGRIDRLDAILDDDGRERLRVVDYKTGGSYMKESDALKDVEALFSWEKYNNKIGYYLQTFLYSSIVSRDSNLNPRHQEVSPALLFIQHAQQEDYDPRLRFGKEPIRDVGQYMDVFEENLRTKLAEIFTQSVDFNKTDDRQTCKSCPFALMCGQA